MNAIPITLNFQLLKLLVDPRDNLLLEWGLQWGVLSCLQQNWWGTPTPQLTNMTTMNSNSQLSHSWSRSSNYSLHTPGLHHQSSQTPHIHTPNTTQTQSSVFMFLMCQVLFTVFWYPGYSDFLLALWFWDSSVPSLSCLLMAFWPLFFFSSWSWIVCYLHIVE